MTIELTEQQKIKLLNSDDVFIVMKDILLREEKIDQEKEHFWMIGLDLANRILFVELVSLGSVKATTVEPMNVFRVAVLKGAVNVMMVHNHPSGELKPSTQDKNITDRLIQVGRILNIKVIDHIIISDKAFLSFLEIGLLQELEQSTKWVPPFELIQQIRKEEKTIRENAVKIASQKNLEKGKKEGEKEGLIKIIKNSLKKGLSPELISEVTGVAIKEIEKLMSI